MADISAKASLALMLLVVQANFISACTPKQLSCARLNGPPPSDFHSTIVNGRPARTVGGIPWRVYLLIESPGVPQEFCGATIIHSRWLLTAAHCFNFFDLRRLNLYVGTSPTRDRAGEFPVVGGQVIIHNFYNMNNFQHDIALVELAPNTFGCHQVARLPQLSWGWDNVELTGPALVSGWGSEYFTGPTLPELMFTYVNLIQNVQCTTMNIPFPPLVNNQICTYDPNTGPCKGDSGGSVDVQVNNNPEWYVYGIISHGADCAKHNTPTVHARIGTYRLWISINTGWEV